MVSLKVDGKKLEVPEGSYLMHAAEKAGVKIPALCHYEGLEHYTSCMVCVVKDRITGSLLPSCSVLAENGMDIITLDDEIFQSRKAALELLLSDHTGDCQAPCQLACPAHMDIPLMNRLLAAGKIDEALRVVDRDIPIPSILGRICKAPCEGACRRKTIDKPVSICLLKRYAGDFGKIRDHSLPEQHRYSNDQEQSHPDKPQSSIDQDRSTKGTRVAVIGGGPAGLSAACYLQRMGHKVILFEKEERAGGLLHEARTEDEHYRVSLEREIKQILDAGIEFKSGVNVDKNKFSKILENHDAVVIATGEMEDGQGDWGPEPGKSGFSVDKATYRTSMEKVFAIGNAVRPVRSAVRAVGHGKEAAVCIDQFLTGREVTGFLRMFNSKFGKLLEVEFAEYLKEASPAKRLEPEKGELQGFDPDEVKEEAARCMHCDCRDIHTCMLRIYSDQYKAEQQRFKQEIRRPVSKVQVHDSVIYEPSKCIKCGICVRMTEQKREKYGFTFIGRGFDVRVGIPFDEKLGRELKELASKIAMACPTGALSEAGALSKTDT